MHNQDFEEYARAKPFNFSIAPTWEAVWNEALGRLDTPRADVRLLDYGCGDGKYFRFFVDSGLSADNVHGLEVSRLRQERCVALGWNNARILEPNSALPYADGSFDLINCMEVIEHIPAAEGRRVVAEFRRVLRPGGFLMLSTPNYPIKRFYDFSDMLLHRKWERLYDDPTHVTHFTYSKLSALLGRHFATVEPRIFKPGYLYKRVAHPFFLHKLFFLCKA